MCEKLLPDVTDGRYGAPADGWALGGAPTAAEQGFLSRLDVSDRCRGLRGSSTASPVRGTERGADGPEMAQTQSFRGKQSTSTRPEDLRGPERLRTEQLASVEHHGSTERPPIRSIWAQGSSRSPCGAMAYAQADLRSRRGMVQLRHGSLLGRDLLLQFCLSFSEAALARVVARLGDPNMMAKTRRSGAKAAYCRCRGSSRCGCHAKAMVTSVPCKSPH